MNNSTVASSAVPPAETVGAGGDISRPEPIGFGQSTLSLGGAPGLELETEFGNLRTAMEQLVVSVSRFGGLAALAATVGTIGYLLL